MIETPSPAIVVGELRDGPLRHLDQVVALEQTGERKLSYTSFRWTVRGFVGDRPEARQPQSWDELVERYGRVEVTQWGRVLNVALTLIVAVSVPVCLISGQFWAAGICVTLFALSVLLARFGHDLDRSWRSGSRGSQWNS